MILSCSNITKAFGTDTILKNISFHIEEQEKAAIVGINGAGKSTLLKIIVGDLPADSGDVVLAKGRTIGYLAQHQDLESDRTIYEEVLEIKRPIIQMEERIRQLEQEMEGREGAALHLIRRTEDPHLPGQAPALRPGPHPFGRAYQPPGYGLHHLAGELLIKL